MAGRRKVQVPPNDPSLNTEYWLQFGSDPEPTVRNKLLYLAIEEVGANGPSSFNSVRICDRLAVSASLINHYFGGRDGLIAEASAIAYRSYVLKLRDAAAAKLPDAPEALRTWMSALIEWHATHPGISEVLNYPRAHGQVSELIHRDFQREITKYFEFNLSVIGRLIVAIRDKNNETLSEGPDDYDRTGLLADPDAVKYSVAIAWAAIGVAVSTSGGHIPSSGSPEKMPIQEQMIDRYIDYLVESITHQLTIHPEVIKA